MRAAMTILWDSFRLLQAKKLFWIALGISMLVALFYASIGFDEQGMTMFFGWKQFENPLLRQGQPEAAAFYVLLFTDVILKFWLAWIAVALALLSTASIFPDFIAEGSIGISLSKPVGRLRLFLLKYLGGLLFVALQVAIFTTIVFLALGWRTGEWNLTVFWAVPVVTFVFSLLYAVAVWIGVWTRSTLFALLGAFLMWGLALLGQWTEGFFYRAAHLVPESGIEIDYRTGEQMEKETVEKNATAVSLHQKAKAAVTPLPKTRDCTTYLKRLIKMKERDSMLAGASLDTLLSGSLADPKMAAAMKRHDERHSAWYVFGTSAIFEAVVLALAAWVFCRRDY
jgi:ABC-type transport system involved in multi-copper enzyme maturation permease subunit